MNAPKFKVGDMVICQDIVDEIPRVGIVVQQHGLGRGYDVLLDQEVPELYLESEMKHVTKLTKALK